jgi:two-component system, OmpR family, sensor histidine kinase CiaH
MYPDRYGSHMRCVTDHAGDSPQSSDSPSLLSATAARQAAQAWQRQFVADASHELRTPLAIMRSEIDVGLRNPGLPPTAREVLESSVEEVDRMSATVENLLTLARMDEGGMQLDRRPTDLREVARSVLDSMRSLSEPSQVGLDLEGEPVAVSVDRERIEQVLTNLVGNAIRFSGTGGVVRVSTWRNGHEAGLSVQDTGPGIPSSMRSRIFERFVRVEAARGSDSGGAGLGLAISKEIVEAHGGRIWIESGDRRGSTFLIALPTEAERPS